MVKIVRRIIKRNPISNNVSVKVTQAFLRERYYDTNWKNKTPPKLIWQEAYSSS